MLEGFERDFWSDVGCEFASSEDDFPYWDLWDGNEDDPRSEKPSAKKRGLPRWRSQGQPTAPGVPQRNE